MQTTRQKKISRLIQKELSKIFHKEMPVFIGSIMATITIVKVTPDLANAKIFVSFFPVEDPEKALEVIKKNSGLFRKRLGESLRKQLRIVPVLEYFVDDSAAYAEEINRLLKK